MISYIETEWMTETPNDLIRRQSEGLLINPLLAQGSGTISDFLPEEKNSQETMLGVLLSIPTSYSPFFNFKKQFKNIDKDLWRTLPEDSSEKVDEYL